MCLRPRQPSFSVPYYLQSNYLMHPRIPNPNHRPSEFWFTSGLLLNGYPINAIKGIFFNFILNTCTAHLSIRDFRTQNMSRLESHGIIICYIVFEEISIFFISSADLEAIFCGFPKCDLQELP